MNAEQGANGILQGHAMQPEVWQTGSSVTQLTIVPHFNHDKATRQASHMLHVAILPRILCPSYPTLPLLKLYVGD